MTSAHSRACAESNGEIYTLKAACFNAISACCAPIQSSSTITSCTYRLSTPSESSHAHLNHALPQATAQHLDRHVANSLKASILQYLILHSKNLIGQIINSLNILPKQQFELHQDVSIQVRLLKITRSDAWPINPLAMA